MTDKNLSTGRSTSHRDNVAYADIRRPERRTRDADDHRGSVPFSERVEELFADLDESAGCGFYRRGRKHARLLTAAHSAAARGDADAAYAYLGVADGLFAPLGEASANDLRDFAVGQFREDEDRVHHLLADASEMEPPLNAGPSPVERSFKTLGRIVALVSTPEAAGSPHLDHHLRSEVLEVRDMMSMLAPIFERAILQGMAEVLQPTARKV